MDEDEPDQDPEDQDEDEEREGIKIVICSKCSTFQGLEEVMKNKGICTEKDCNNQIVKSIKLTKEQVKKLKE